MSKKTQEKLAEISINLAQVKRTKKTIWTPEEDRILASEIRNNANRSWEEISKKLKNKTGTQCLHRWTKVLDPSLKKGAWSTEEDNLLIGLVEKYGNSNWAKISEFITGRTSKQCRERWRNHLDPSINHSKWTDEEDDKLIRLHQKYGNRWATIAKYIEGRPDNMIKNHWNSTLKRKLKQIAKNKKANTQTTNNQIKKRKAKSTTKKKTEKVDQEPNSQPPILKAGTSLVSYSDSKIQTRNSRRKLALDEEIENEKIKNEKKRTKTRTKNTTNKTKPTNPQSKTIQNPSQKEAQLKKTKTTTNTNEKTTKPTTRSKTKAKPKPKAKSKTNSKTNSKTKSKTKSNPKTKSKAKPKAKPKPKAKAKAKSKAKPKAKKQTRQNKQDQLDSETEIFGVISTTKNPNEPEKQKQIQDPEETNLLNNLLRSPSVFSSPFLPDGFSPRTLLSPYSQKSPFFTGFTPNISKDSTNIFSNLKFNPNSQEEINEKPDDNQIFLATPKSNGSIYKTNFIDSQKSKNQNPNIENININTNVDKIIQEQMAKSPNISSKTDENMVVEQSPTKFDSQQTTKPVVLSRRKQFKEINSKISVSFSPVFPSTPINSALRNDPHIFSSGSFPFFNSPQTPNSPLFDFQQKFDSDHWLF
ncbi:myb-related protein 3r-1-like [Anaeramoeba ignava]|uniref:Myb-related protein 3r-1-like n=1 Tax=Anaeramoeba ignava TaxID=1746090 RepID=A0A9Q0LKL7_ANAIG|nr:myb-related protein 3r-1-like [Anaeramoeba ignava]